MEKKERHHEKVEATSSDPRYTVVIEKPERDSIFEPRMYENSIKKKIFNTAMINKMIKNNQYEVVHSPYGFPKL